MAAHASATAITLAPWLALAGLGAFHGLNPAMGWLFAVALGLHRGKRAVVYLSLLPIAAGHALSVAVVAIAVALFGLAADAHEIALLGGAMLLVWAGVHAAWGHRGRVRVGMTTGMGGLALWSFAMATSHGAGLMLVPVLVPLCLTASPARALTLSGSLPVALAAVAVHMGAMLAVTGAIAALIYEWVGVGILRKAWINLDVAWTAALAVAGAFLIFNSL